MCRFHNCVKTLCSLVVNFAFPFPHLFVICYLGRGEVEHREIQNAGCRGYRVQGAGVTGCRVQLQGVSEVVEMNKRGRNRQDIAK